jgi:hypothetical protein
VRRSQFFPSRRYLILCPTCHGLARLPWKGVLVGLSVMLSLMIVGVLALKPLFQPGLETVADFFWAVVAFLAVTLSCTWIACWVCSGSVRALTPYRRGARRLARS